MKKNAWFHLLYTAQNAVFPLVTAMYLSRVLAPEGVGQVAYGKNLLSYFTMVSALGIPQYAMRELGRGGKDGDRLVSELAVLSFGISAACALGCGVFLLWRHPGDGVLWALALEVVSQTVNLEWLYQGKEDFGFLALKSLGEKLGTLVMVLCFVRGREDVLAYCLIYALGKSFGTLWGLVHARRYGRLRLKGLAVGRHVAPVLTLMLGGIAAGLYSRVDISMLGWLASADSVGYYANAHKVLNIVSALASAVSAVFLPRLSREFGQAGYEKTAAAGLRAVLILAVPGCVGLWLVAEDLVVVLFGGEFLPAATVLRILSALVLLKGLNDSLCYQVLISAGQERALTAAYLLAGAANAGLNGLLIPRFGHGGAAVASAVGELVVMALLLPKARKIVKPKVGGVYLAGLLLGTAAMAAAVLGLQRYRKKGILRLAACVAAGAAVYFAAVAAVWKAGKWDVHGNGNSDRSGAAVCGSVEKEGADPAGRAAGCGSGGDGQFSCNTEI